MPLTIYLKQVYGEEAAPLYLQLEFDGVFWPLPTPGLEFVVWDPDSFIFCSSSQALRNMLARSFRNMRKIKSAVGYSIPDHLLIPHASNKQIVRALGFYRNPVVLIT